MALLTTASALVAPRPLTARPRRPTPKATMQMGLKDTIGNIFVPPPPPPPVTVVEGAESTSGCWLCAAAPEYCCGGPAGRRH